MKGRSLDDIFKTPIISQNIREFLEVMIQERVVYPPWKRLGKQLVKFFPEYRLPSGLNGEIRIFARTHMNSLYSKLEEMINEAVGGDRGSPD